MLGKLTGLARALALLLSLIAGFVAIPGLEPQTLKLVLIVLGLIAGISYCDAGRVGLILTALVLPAVGVTLSALPAVGTGLSAVAGNIGVAVTAAVATSIAIRFVTLLKGDIGGLAG